MPWDRDFSILRGDRLRPSSPWTATRRNKTRPPRTTAMTTSINPPTSIPRTPSPFPKTTSTRLGAPYPSGPHPQPEARPPRLTPPFLQPLLPFRRPVPCPTPPRTRQLPQGLTGQKGPWTPFSSSPLGDRAEGEGTPGGTGGPPRSRQKVFQTPPLEGLRSGWRGCGTCWSGGPSDRRAS